MENALTNCQFFLERKKRYCRMTVKNGVNYCAEHIDSLEKNTCFNNVRVFTARIRCPIDNSHTCYESKLSKHLKVCNAKRRIDSVPEYIVKGVNRGDVNLKLPPHIPLSNVEQILIDSVIQKVEIAYDQLPEVGELILEHKVLDTEIHNPNYGINTKKHLIQNSSLLAHLERANLIQENTCFIEFGAGKGKLTYWLAKIIDGNVKVSTILVVDRSSPRHKNDNKLKNEQSLVKLIRIRADIADLSLNKIAVVKQNKHKVGIAKHLCGAATDLTIRCLGQSIPEDSTVSGLVVAFCCHHRCDYGSYVGKQYLNDSGILPEEFSILCSIASWATCGRRESRRSPRCEEKLTHGQKLDERESIGRKVKTLLNWGRVKYLNNIGFNSHLYYYTKPEVSLENMCVVAVRK